MLSTKTVYSTPSLITHILKERNRRIMSLSLYLVRNIMIHTAWYNSRCICYRRNGSSRRIRFAWPKSHRRNGTRDEHKHLDWIYEKQICSFFLLLKMHFSVRTVFQSERVLNISKYGHFRNENTILHQSIMSKYGRISNTNVDFFTVFKNEISLF